MKTSELIKRYRITDGSKFHLKQSDPGDTHGWKNELKKEASVHLEKSIKRLAELQDKLYAQDQHALLLIFQAMDAAGKDGTIKHVMSGINPQGCQVYSFKSPSAEELDHDYLWRSLKALPQRGHIGIFNRSYYEEVLVVRVHPEVLAKQKVPKALLGKKLWDQRFEDINAIETYLTRNGTTVLKFFLHVSKKEQKRRFLERLNDPAKNWKFSTADVEERKHFDEYMEAYEDAIRRTASKRAPWYVVPADNKWFTRLVVSAAITRALEDMNLEYPSVDDKKRGELKTVKRALENE